MSFSIHKMYFEFYETYSRLFIVSFLHDLTISLFSVNEESKKAHSVIHSTSQWLVAEDQETRSSKVTKQGTMKVSKSKAPPSKLQPREKGVVVCKTNLPTFVSHPDFNCEVILTFSMCDKTEKEEMNWDEHQKRVKLWCGTVTMDTTSLIEGKYDMEAGSRKATLGMHTFRNHNFYCL